MANVVGYVDGLEDGAVVGWALPEAVARNCHITVLDGNGDVVAQGRASRLRSDLARLEFGRTNLGFRIRGLDLTRSGSYRVLADGVELHNSPLVVEAQSFDGVVQVAGGKAVGWIAERVRSSSTILVELFDQDGALIGAAEARPADHPSVTGQLRTPFSVDLAQSCFGRGEVLLKACANGTAFATANCDLAVKGHVETVSARGVSGWLFSPDAPQISFTLDILVDGLVVGTARCDKERLDVQQEYPASRAPGFEFRLPERYGDAREPLIIALRLSGCGWDLFDGPTIVADRAGVVAAAHRIARLAAGRQGGLSVAERAILQNVMGEFVARQRAQEGLVARGRKRSGDVAPAAAVRLNVIVPVYRDVALTLTCIASALKAASDRDRIVVINDNSPEPGMEAMLAAFDRLPNVSVLTNAVNQGFVKSVNRALRFCGTGDVLLLNSDAQIYDGGLDELCAVAQSSGDVGTVTAISNNATVFSYPHPELRREALADVGWDRLAEVALKQNAGLTIDMPTGHGFCLLIKREVLDQVGLLDESFGRGYGEENDFCMRAADLGFRNVVAGGALVRHQESVSFTGDKTALLTGNLRRLQGAYPEYHAVIMRAIGDDPLREARWALDVERLSATRRSGVRYVLILCHRLGGGTEKAIGDIERLVGYGGRRPMILECRDDGYMELAAEEPLLRAVFAPTDRREAFRVLDAAAVDLVLIHSLIGYSAAFVRDLIEWHGDRRAIFYAHDYYALCPRVTMINALGEFCDVADTATCERCVAIGGTHLSSRMDELTVAEHRELFGRLLASATQAITPSETATSYLARVFADAAITTVPHPETPRDLPAHPRQGDINRIVIIGGIGPHKGSAKLLEVVQRARLTHPDLSFTLIGHSDIDVALAETGNIEITGRYDEKDLDRLVADTGGRIALFLSLWPETYAYTLSEAVRYGYIPLVPDIGAPAERIRHAGFGVVLPFPFSAASVLQTIASVIAGEIIYARDGSGPDAFTPNPESIARTMAAYGGYEHDAVDAVAVEFPVDAGMRRGL